MDTFVDRMRGRELVRSLSFIELLSLCVWCILAIVYKLLNIGFAGLDRVLGKRFDEVIAKPDNVDSWSTSTAGEVCSFLRKFVLPLPLYNVTNTRSSSWIV